MQITLGNEIDERYELVGVLGTGGFAVVYKARQKQFDRIVAIKVLNSDVLPDSENLARFEREAKAMSALKHRNICSIYGFGRWQEAPYMVMEYVQGKSLETILAEQGPLEPERAIRLISQVLDGLFCAHNAGVIHRDLKPSNIIVSKDEDELPRIIDFGLAKLMPGYGVTYQRLTECGFTIGTVHYMSPEQCTGGLIDQRTDIYAAGCILYQCLTGATPFDELDGTKLMFQHLSAPAPHITENSSSSAYQDLDEFIQKCLAKNPADRFSDAESAANELKDIIARGKANAAQATTKPKLAITKGLKSASGNSKTFPKKATLIGISVVFCSSLALSAMLMPNSAVLRPISQPQIDSVTMCDRYLGRRSITDLQADEGTGSIDAVLDQYEHDHKLDLRRAAILYRHQTEHYARMENFARTRNYAAKWLSLEEKLGNHNQAQRDYDSWMVNIVSLERRWPEAIAMAKRNLQTFCPDDKRQIRSAERQLLTLYVSSNQMPKAMEFAKRLLTEPNLDSETKHVLLRQVANLQVIQGKYSDAEKILTPNCALHDGSAWKDMLALCRSSLAQHRYTCAADWLKKAKTRRMDIWGPEFTPSFNITLLQIATSAVNDSESQTQSLIQSKLKDINSIADQTDFVNNFDEQLCMETLGEFKSKKAMALFADRIKKARNTADGYGKKSDSI